MPIIDPFEEKKRPLVDPFESSGLVDPFEGQPSEPPADTSFTGLADGVEPPKPRGILGEMGTGLLAGTVVEVPAMLGGALQFVAPKGSAAESAGRKLKEDAELIRRFDPDLAPSIDPAQRPVAAAFGQGARMIPQSVLPGAAVALAIPSAVGAGAAAAASGLLGALPAGLAQAQNTMDAAAERGVDEKTARAAALKTGAIEWGGEAVANSLGAFGRVARALRILPAKPLAKEAGDLVAKMAAKKTVGQAAAEMGGDYLKTLATETGTEMGQQYGQAAVERGAGISDVDPVQSAKEVIAPTVGMTTLLAPFGIGGQMRQNRQNATITEALKDKSAPAAVRQTAADHIAAQLKDIDPDAAATWKRSADAAIQAGASIDIGDRAKVDSILAGHEDVAGMREKIAVAIEQANPDLAKRIREAKDDAELLKTAQEAESFLQTGGQQQAPVEATQTPPAAPEPAATGILGQMKPPAQPATPLPTAAAPGDVSEMPEIPGPEGARPVQDAEVGVSAQPAAKEGVPAGVPPISAPTTAPAAQPQESPPTQPAAPVAPVQAVAAPPPPAIQPAQVALEAAVAGAGSQADLQAKAIIEAIGRGEQPAATTLPPPPQSQPQTGASAPALKPEAPAGAIPSAAERSMPARTKAEVMGQKPAAGEPSPVPTVQPAATTDRTRTAAELIAKVTGNAPEIHMGSADAIVKMVDAKDADALADWIARVPGDNEGMKSAFENLTGQKLPKGVAKIRAFLDQWAGVTPEERTRRTESKKQAFADEQARKEEERRPAKEQAIVDRAASNAIIVKAGDKDMTVKEYVDSLIAQGADRLVQTKRGAVNRWAISDPAGRGMVLNPAFLDYARIAIRNKREGKPLPEPTDYEKNRQAEIAALPFKVGDRVKAGEIEGVVEKLGSVTSAVRTDEGSRFPVLNKDITVIPSAQPAHTPATIAQEHGVSEDQVNRAYAMEAKVHQNFTRQQILQAVTDELRADKAGYLREVEKDAPADAEQATVESKPAKAKRTADENDAELDQAHRLAKPIKGPTGAKIVGYEWVSDLVEGMYRDRRVSDWSRSQISSPTGREIVHLFWVQTPDGNETIMGVGAAQKALGLSVPRLYTIAKNEQAAQAYRQQQDAAEAKIWDDAAKDTPSDAAILFRKNNTSPLRSVKENNAIFDKSVLFEKGGKYVRRMPQATEAMQKNGWTLVQDDPAKSAASTPTSLPPVESGAQPLSAPEGSQTAKPETAAPEAARPGAGEAAQKNPMSMTDDELVAWYAGLNPAQKQFALESPIGPRVSVVVGRSKPKRTRAEVMGKKARPNPVWKVKYQHVADRQARMPFFMRTSMAQAPTRAAAIKKVQEMFPTPTYDRFSASVVEGGKAEYQFEDAKPQDVSPESTPGTPEPTVAPEGMTQTDRERLRAKQDAVIRRAERRNMDMDTPISGVQNAAPTVNQLRTVLYPKFEASMDAFLDEGPQPVEEQPAPAAAVNVEEQPSGDVKVSVPSKDKPGVPMKEQKKYLMAEIEKAIEQAPEAKVEPYQREPKYGETEEAYTARLKANSEIGERNKAKLGSVVIEVPGDGTFTVLNAKSALIEFRDAAKSMFPAAPAKRTEMNLPSTEAPTVVKVGKRPHGEDNPAWSKLLEPFASTDQSREPLLKPWRGGDKTMLATDGRSLAAALGVKGPQQKKSKGGREMPHFEQVVPGYKAGAMPENTGKQTDVAVPDSEKMIRQLRQAVLARNPDDGMPTVGFFLMPDGTLAIASTTPEYGTYESADVSQGKFMVALDGDRAVQAITFLRRAGNEAVTVRIGEDEFSPLLFMGEREYVVQMPMRGVSGLAEMGAKDKPVPAGENLMITGRSDGRVTLADTNGSRLGTFESAEKAAAWAAENGYGIAPGSPLKPKKMFGEKKARKAKASVQEMKSFQVSYVTKDGSRASTATVEADTAADAIATVEADGKTTATAVDGKPIPGVTRMGEKKQAPAEPQATPDADKPQGIAEAGVELTRNRRNLVAERREWSDFENMNPALKSREVTKAKVWPKPDYKAMIDGGMEPMVAHIVKQAYDGIAAKPQTRTAPTDADFKRYVDAVNRVRDGIMAWANDTQAVGAWAAANARIASAMTGRGGTIAISEFAGQKSKSILDTVYPNGWRENREDIIVAGGNRLMRALQPNFDEAQRAMKAIQKGWPEQREAWQVQGYDVISGDSVTPAFYVGHRYNREGGNGDPYVAITLRSEIGGRAITIEDHVVPMATSQDDPGVKAWVDERTAAMAGKFIVLNKRHRLVGVFDSQEAAEDGARETTKREAGGGISDKGISVERAERIGPSRRMEGEDVSAQRVIDDFGLKAVNFGNWMKTPAAKAEAQLHLNHAYDALHDLADVLGVPPKAVGLNGMLGLAIGAQGNGGTHAAHFVPGVNEINLTRTAGAGTLAHEWGHALDHYFAVQAGLSTSGEPFLTEHARTTETMPVFKDGKKIGTKPRFEGIRPEIVKAFRAIVEAMRTRALSQEELAGQKKAAEQAAVANRDRWLASIRRDFAGQEVEFDKLVERIKAGDLGDGKIAVSRNLYASPVLIEMRDLYKQKHGRAYSIDNIKGVQSWIDSIEFKKANAATEVDHRPQTTNSKYLNEALKLDDEKKGKKYWSTSLEMFARAFDAYVADKLDAEARKNTYLSLPGRAGAEAEPQGEERTAINAAFDVLTDAIETRETPSGVAMFAKSSRLNGEFWLRNGKAKSATGEDEANHEAVVMEAAAKEVGDALDEAGASDLADIIRSNAGDPVGVRTAINDWTDSQPDAEALMDMDHVEMITKRANGRVSEGMVKSLVSGTDFDARVVGMQEFEWVRVAGNNVQTEVLNDDRMRSIARGLTDAYGDDVDGEVFNIEVNKTRAFYRNVPYEVIAGGDVAALRTYKDRGGFAKGDESESSAPAVTREQYTQTLADETRRTPWAFENSEAMDYADAPADVRAAVEGGEGQEATQGQPLFYRSRNGQVRAVTIGNRSWYFLDRYDGVEQLRQDIREESAHRLINELGGKAWNQIAYLTYGGKWNGIASEITRNYGYERGTPDFNHELVAKAYRDGQADPKVWRRFIDAVVAAFRQLARRMGYALDLSDAEVRNFVAGLVEAKANSVRGQAMGGMQAAKSDIRDIIRKTRTITTSQAAAVLGDRPEYLDAVVEFMESQRKKLAAGQMTSRDIAKALAITVGSIGATEQKVTTFKRTVPDFSVDRQYLSWNRDGDERIRPEDAVAWWLTTDMGQRALNAIEAGKFDKDAWNDLLRVRKAFGRPSDLARLMVPMLPNSRSKWNLTNIAGAVKSINSAGANVDALMKAVNQVQGISDGKQGFIGALLGVGNVPTVDAVEINFWLAGKATAKSITDETMRAKVEAWKGASREGLGDEVTRRIANRINDLRESGSVGEIPDETAGAIIHHWLWDRAKGAITPHAGMMDAMVYAAKGAPQEDFTQDELKAALRRVMDLATGYNVGKDQAKEAARARAMGKAVKTKQQIADARLAGQMAGLKKGREQGRREAFRIAVKQAAIAVRAARAEAIDEIQAIKKQIADAVNEQLPSEERGKLVTALANAKTQDDVYKALVRVDEYAEQAVRRGLVNSIKRELQRVATSKNIAVDYVQKIRALMLPFAVRTPLESTMRRLQATKDYLDDAASRGEDVEVPAAVLAKLNVLTARPLTELTSEQLEDLLGQVQLLAELGKTKLRARRTLDRLQKEKDAADIAASGTRPLNDRDMERGPIGEGTPAMGSIRNMLRTAGDKASHLWSYLMPMDVVFDELDNHKGYQGPLHRIFKARPDAGFNMVLRDNRIVEDELVKQMKLHGIGLKESERIGVYAISQQSGGMEKLTRNNGYTKEQIEAVVLTPNEQAFLAWMQSTMDSRFPAVTKVMKDVYNQPVTKVNDYFPMQTDWSLTEAEVITGYMLDESGVLVKTDDWLKKNPNMGFTMKRKGAGKQAVRVDAVKVFTKHMHDVHYLVHMAPITKYMSELARREDVAVHLGDAGQRLVLEYVDTLARKGSVPEGTLMRGLDLLRRNIGAATLGFKATSFAIQPTSLINAVGMIGHWAGKGALDMANDKRWRAFVKDHIPEVHNRVGDDPAYLEYGGGWTMHKIRKYGFWPLQKLDMLTAASVAVGAYQKYAHEHGLEIDFDNPDPGAVDYAELIVRRTQSTPYTKDVPLMVSRGKGFGSLAMAKAFLQFQNFTMNEFSLLAHDGLRDAVKRGQVMKAFNIFLWSTMAGMATVGVRGAIKGLLGSQPPDDDEDAVAAYWKRVMMEKLQVIPFMSQFISTAFYGGEPFPVGDTVRDAIMAAGRIKTGKETDTKVRGAAALGVAASTLAGVPGTVQASAFIKDSLKKEPAGSGVTTARGAGFDRRDAARDRVYGRRPPERWP